VGWFGIVKAMNANAEADLPANEGPEANAADTPVMERTRKAVAVPITAMPDSQVLNLMAAGKSDPRLAQSSQSAPYLREAFDEEDKLKALIFYGSFRNATSRTSRM
jgi:hypothetical protein